MNIRKHSPAMWTNSKSAARPLSMLHLMNIARPRLRNSSRHGYLPNDDRAKNRLMASVGMYCSDYLLIAGL